MQLMKNGLYKFNYDNLDSAHETCENQTEQALLENKKVVVANVFSTVYNTFPYLYFAKRCGLKEIKVIHLTGNYGISIIPRLETR